ncbi:MAG TPA: hypothetical protein PKO33_01350 [Pyrinomonadaceae bacterium]|nr:hypothetical protein [Pyrinomonadaceae bacterium]
MALVYPEDISVKVPDAARSQYALNNWSANGDPSVNDDETDGYEVGSFWFNGSYPYRLWVCLDPLAGAAVWIEVTVERNHMWVLATAGENLAAQDAVNLYSDAGTLKVRLADADDTTKPCHGFVVSAVTSGNPAYAITANGIVRTGLSGLTVGAEYYLSTTAGALTSTAPSTSGNSVQRLGIAISSSSILWERGSPVSVP